jgi:hypothetical protein
LPWDMVGSRKTIRVLTASRVMAASGELEASRVLEASSNDYSSLLTNHFTCICPFRSGGSFGSCEDIFPLHSTPKLYIQAQYV